MILLLYRYREDRAKDRVLAEKEDRGDRIRSGSWRSENPEDTLGTLRQETGPARSIYHFYYHFLVSS